MFDTLKNLPATLASALMSLAPILAMIGKGGPPMGPSAQLSFPFMFDPPQPINKKETR